MPALSHFFTLLALSSLALLSVLAPVTEALSLDSPHVHLARHHDIALKKRDSSSQPRCKPRPKSPAAHVYNSTSVQDTKPAPSSSVPHTTNTVNSNNGGTLPKIGIAYDSSDYTPLQFFKTPKVGP